jgi:hypothetical protein
MSQVPLMRRPCVDCGRFFSQSARGQVCCKTCQRGSKRMEYPSPEETAAVRREQEWRRWFERTLVEIQPFFAESADYNRLLTYVLGAAMKEKAS